MASNLSACFGQLTSQRDILLGSRAVLADMAIVSRPTELNCSSRTSDVPGPGAPVLGRCFERCAPQSSDMPSPVSGSPTTTTCNGFMQHIAVSDKPQEKRSVEGPGSGQTPMAGWFQPCGFDRTDGPDHGPHGGLGALPVSIRFVSDFHPAPTNDMLRGRPWVSGDGAVHGGHWSPRPASPAMSGPRPPTWSTHEPEERTSAQLRALGAHFRAAPTCVRDGSLGRV